MAAAVWTGPTQGNRALTDRQILDAPFNGAPIANIGTLSIGAGTAATLVLTVPQILAMPILNVSTTAAAATNIIVLPPAALATGAKVRFVMMTDALVNRILRIGAGTVAVPATAQVGQVLGGATVAAVAISFVIANTYVSITAAALIGDWVEFTSNGTYWSVAGATTVAAGFVSA